MDSPQINLDKEVSGNWIDSSKMDQTKMDSTKIGFGKNGHNLNGFCRFFNFYLDKQVGQKRPCYLNCGKISRLVGLKTSV